MHGNGNVWVAGCNANGDTNVEHTLAYSYDGLQWTGIGKTLFSNAVNDVAWNGERWLAIGSSTGGSGSTTIASSSDGITWDASYSFVDTVDNTDPCLAWNGSYWLAGGYGRVSAETTEQIPVRYTSIAAGYGHSLALPTDGKVYTWGYNFYGQLGLGTSGDDADEDSPTLITALSNITVSSIAAGIYHSLALTTDGEVYAWGGNEYGQLGLGTIGYGTDEDSPTLITALSNITVSSIAAGYYHSLALTTDGKVYAWGSNGNGQLGLGTSGDGTYEKSPTLITALSNITVSSIAAGNNNSLALTTDGKVYAWGYNEYGQLGLSTSGFDADKDSPTLITALSIITVSSIAAGAFHSLALTTDEEVYAWGYNYYGQLGLDTSGIDADEKSPTLITALSNITVSSIAAGNRHSLALTTDGKVDWAGREWEGERRERER